MIDITNINLQQGPLKEFNKFYNNAMSSKQQSIEAACISTIDASKKTVHSRFINIKYVDESNFIFFSNYESNKANEIKTCSKVSLAFYWNTVNIQIRIEGEISKLDELVSDEHFRNRSKKKNALAISSNQSKEIDSYETVQKNYQQELDKISDLSKRPIYWGGYTISPQYFEFWEGHESRINKRSVYKKNISSWNHYFVQP